MEDLKRKISLDRAEELRHRIDDYINARKLIPKGLEMEREIHGRKKRILDVLGGTQDDWEDYRWQLKNRVTEVETLSKIINLSEKEAEQIRTVGKRFRWAVSPYYLSLIDPNDRFDPVKLMSIPTYAEETDKFENLDPMAEEYTNPAGSITRRYPDRLIINVTNECAMYCRHCQRRRNIGQKDQPKSRALIEESIGYIRDNEEIRDVLITGGDPLTMPDDQIEWIVSKIREIEHVDYIRIGTRTPVTMPQRITDELCNMLKKYHPVFINTHFNHPIEVTARSKQACEKLSDAGIPLGNQAVLLNGINNDKFVMRCLNHELLKCRVRPYYIFHAKHVRGTSHFKTSIDDGIEIMEYLRGYTSGLAIPTFIVNAPNGKGKIPILPEYLVSRGKDFVIMRTWEGEVIKYANKRTEEIKHLIENAK